MDDFFYGYSFVIFDFFVFDFGFDYIKKGFVVCFEVSNGVLIGLVIILLYDIY